MARIIKSFMSDRLYGENPMLVNTDNTDRSENYQEDDVLLSDIQDDELIQMREENSLLKEKILGLESTISDLRKNFDNEVAESVKKKVDSQVDEYKVENDNIFKSKITNFEGLMSKITNDYNQYLFDSKSTLIDIVFTSVYKLISSKYSSDEIRNIVDQAIAEVNDSSKITVFISKNDYEIVKKQSINNENLKFKIDERVKCGGCIIESDTERLDCRLDRKLEIFKNLMLGIYEDDA